MTRIPGTNDFESAIISTNAAGLLFGDGIIESRLRYDAGTGYWPAFWMLIPGSGVRDEIDILEAYPNPTKWPFPNRHEMNLHYVHGSHLVSNNVHDAGIDLTADFHVFGLERRGGTVTAYLDGVAWKTVSVNVPTGPMYVLYDLKVGSFHSCTDASTPNGQMVVEWLRFRQ